MKRLLRLSIFLLQLFVSGTLFAQSPFWSDNFESYAGTGVIPSGFGGGMLVYGNHGTSASKALTIQFSPFKSKDSTITPSIGPLPAGASFSFDYRYVTYIAGNPFNGYTINSETLEISVAVDGGSFGAPLLTINSSNHVSALEFATKTIDLSAYAGQNIQLKIKGVRGNSSDFYLDVDNLSVSVGSAGTNINSSIPEFTVFPNPSSEKYIALEFSELVNNAKLELHNMLGAVVMKKNINSLKMELEVDHLPRGVYYLKIDTGKKQALRKLVLR